MVKSRLGQIGSRVGTIETRRVLPPPKVAAPIYSAPEYQEWRGAVIARAGGRCEAVEHGRRCWKSAPRCRMFADHVIEVSDGGARFDPENGQCLCGSHHTAKTAQARAERHASGPVIA
jgi:5-methylcytosine-specific restriction protein A